MKTYRANPVSGALAKQARRAAWSAIALAAALIAAPAGAVTIDSFITNQANVVTPGAPTVATGAADIIGTRRAIASNLLAGAGPVTTGVAGGVLNLSVTNTAPDSRGEGLITWDGDITAGNLNTTGLLPHNLRAANHSAVRIRVNSATAGTELVFDIYSSAGSASRGALRLPAVAAATDFFLSYTHDFAPLIGTGANFTAVTAMQMRVRGTEVAVTVDIVDTIGPSVTATKRDLDLTNTPIAAPVLEGSTFKYRVQIGNTAGQAEGVDLTDTVDANTTLNAATVLATPVALNDTILSLGNVDRTSAAPGVLANDIDPDSAGAAPELIVAAASTGAQATSLGGTINLAANGSFTYAPPVGVGNAVDTFTYTLQDNDGQTDTAQIRFVLGPRIWFVDDAHGGTNVGTSANPFVGFTGTNVNGAGGAGDQDGPGDIIFMYAGNHSAAIVLEAGQTLWGEGDALIVDNFSVVAAGTRPALSSSGTAITLASNNTLRGFNIGNSSATGFDIAGNTFGTLTVSNVDLSGAGGALNLNTGTLAAIIGSIAATSGPHGIDLNTVTGTLTVSGPTAISGIGTNGFGIRVQASGTLTTNLNGNTTITAPNGLMANTGGTLNFSGTANSISATAGPAVNLTSTSLGTGATFSSVSSAGSATTGVNLDTVTGNFIANGGSIATAAGIDFDVNAGSSTITYAGSITNIASRSVEITSRTGGTVTLSGNINDTGTGILVQNNNVSGAPIINFSGATKTINTGANVAVRLDNNDLATINFTGGGLDIDTSGANGFNAINGAAGITVQGAGNSITTATGIALVVTDSTIGASGLTFQSISANGGAAGIVLGATGSSGGLTVSGTGSAGSGGTIQNSTSAGVLLTNTRNINLSRIIVQTSGDDGIFGTSVTSFTLADSSIINNGNSTSDEGIYLLDPAGAITLTNVVATGNAHNNLWIYDNNNTDGNTTLAISGGSFSSTGNANGNHGALVEVAGTGVMGVSTISNVTFNNNKVIGLQVITGGTGSINDLTVTNSTFQDTGTGNSQEISMDFAKAQSSSMTVKVLNNTILGHNSHGMNFFTGAEAGVTGVFNARVVGNIIGTSATAGSGSRIGNCIRVNINGDTDATVLLDGNTLRECPVGRGIEIIGRNGLGGLDVTVTNNNVNHVNLGFLPGTSDFPLAAILVQSNCIGVCNRVRSDVRLNTVPAGTAFDLLPTHISLVETSGAPSPAGTSTLELVDTAPASASCTAQLTSTNTGSASANAGCGLIPGPISTPP